MRAASPTAVGLRGKAPLFAREAPHTCFLGLFVHMVLSVGSTKPHGEAAPRFPTASPGDHMRLDSKSVAALHLGGKKDVIHFDDAMPGFGFRLRLGGGGRVLRTWIVQYRRAGASRRVLLGSAEVLSAEQARAQAKKVLAKVALGADPQAERTERRKADRVTFRSVVEEYLADKKSDVRRHTLRQITRYLTSGYFKPLHGMPADTVARKDVAARLLVIKREHSPIVAARARAALSAFFTWAMQMGLVENNPVIGSPMMDAGKPRERVLSDDEIARIWAACRDDDYGRIVRLLILLGARRQEVGGMTRDEIGEDGVWRLPAERSKNDRGHELPLVPMALAIIKDVPQIVGRQQLFGERSGRGFSPWDSSKQALDARSGVADWTLHDIRRTLSTRLHDLGVAPHFVEQILNHQGHRGTVGGTYNKSPYANEVRAALALWADHVRSIVEGVERKVLAFQPAERV
jgi:integrase